MKKVPYFDAHCDTLFNVRRQIDMKNYALRPDGCPAGYLWKNDGHLDLRRLHEGYSKAVQFFAVCLNMRFTPAQGMFYVYQTMQRVFTRELAACSDFAVQCRSAAEAKAANAEGKVAAILTCEGAELLDCDPKNLEWAHEVGVKAINLTWNHENFLCGSCASAPQRGLNGLGREFVRVMQKYGILVDVSHCSDAAFRDLMKITEKPVIASHSDSRALVDHRRNLTDDMFRAVAETGGCVGINLWPTLLSGRESATIDDAVRHIEHFLELGGEKSVGLGADLDGVESLPQGMSGVQDTRKLWDALKARGYGDELLEDLFYNNFMRVIA